MGGTQPDGPATGGATRRPCQGLSLVGLAQLIAEEADRDALREFHDHRTPFRVQGGTALSLVRFVELLCRTPVARRLVGQRGDLLERAYDLTLDKFCNLPSPGAKGPCAKSDGPDCRLYFRAFVQQMRQWREDNELAAPIEEEIAATQCLQRHVMRQFRQACLEARRGANPARTRYAWHVNGGGISVWMPASVSGRERQRWLEQNVEDPDPLRPGERGRVQAIVNGGLGMPRRVPLDDKVMESAPSISCLPDDRLDEGIQVKGLPEVVGEEKAGNLWQQRPAVRALGGDGVRLLVQRIFAELAAGQYEEKPMAQAFGLSRAALSRFAGSRWRTSPSGRIPDLWLNVAQTLARHAAFVEAAQEAGVWPRVEQLLAGEHAVRTEADL